jgi:hypothetical protein
MAGKNKILAQIEKHDFTKELQDFEYETKFEVTDKNLTDFGVLKKIEGGFDGNQRFVLVKIKNGDKLITHVSFFTLNDTEYSIFKYRGARMVKIKKHRIIKSSPFFIFKNNEKLVIDKNEFLKLKNLRHRFKRHNHILADLGKFIKESPLVYQGEMIKHRVKDFVFDTVNGRIYAVAVTFCKSGGRIQKQFEVEYAGYSPGFKNSVKNIEKQVIAGVQELSEYIYNSFPGMLKSSVERKFEFVKKLNPKA